MTLARSLWFRQIVLPLLLLAGFTAFFRFTAADIDWIRDSRAALGMATWKDGDAGIWGLLKNFGVVPAFLTTLLAIFGLVGGLASAQLAHWVKPSLFIILVLAIGSGVVSNLILKDHWGRPRPKHVIELGGTEKFLPVLTPNFGEKGKSFPAGHPTMGYFFFALGMLYRKRRPVLARLAFGGAIVLGTLLGISRMVQGGHFPSDVLWAAGIMWFVSLGLLHALRLENFSEETLSLPAVPARRPRWIGIGLGAGFLLLLGVGLISIPTSRSQQIDFQTAPAETVRLDFDFEGTLRIQPGPHCELKVDFDGVGTPKARAWIDFDKTPNGFQAIEKRSGFFTEKNLNAVLTLTPGEYVLHRSSSVKLLKSSSGVLPTDESDREVLLRVGKP